MKGSQKSEIRAYIKARGVLKIPAKQILKELCDIYGSSAVSIATVRRWLHKLQNGKKLASKTVTVLGDLVSKSLKLTLLL